MQPLPAMLYAIRAWKNAKVGINYHVHVNNALYSVPHAYARKQGHCHKVSWNLGDSDWLGDLISSSS